LGEREREREGWQCGGTYSVFSKKKKKNHSHISKLAKSCVFWW